MFGTSIAHRFNHQHVAHCGWFGQCARWRHQHFTSLHSTGALPFFHSVFDVFRFRSRIQRFIGESTDIASISFRSSNNFFPGVSSFVVLISSWCLSCSFSLDCSSSFSLDNSRCSVPIEVQLNPVSTRDFCSNSVRHSTRIELRRRKAEEINIKRTNQLHTIYIFLPFQ